LKYLKYLYKNMPLFTKSSQMRIGKNFGIAFVTIQDTLKLSSGRQVLASLTLYQWNKQICLIKNTFLQRSVVLVTTFPS